jgi:hypothetical protein
MGHCVLPVRQHNLALKLPLHRSDTLRMIHRQRTDMGSLLRDIDRLHPAQRHGRAQDRLLVGARDVRTGQDDFRKDHARVGRVRAQGCLLPLVQRALDPVRVDHRLHQFFCLGELLELHTIGHDVCGRFDGQPPFVPWLKDFAIVLPYDLRVLLCTGLEACKRIGTAIWMDARLR